MSDLRYDPYSEEALRDPYSIYKRLRAEKPAYYLEQYDAWAKGSHHSVATCNDCHAPHSTLPAKLFVKGLNGGNHSVAFTTGWFTDPIRITRLNERVTESACRYCHAQLTRQIEPTNREEDAVSCIRCHGDVGHDT